MPWSGGSYTKGNNATGGWTGDASLGIGIEAGRHDTQDNDFATGINNCLTKDGSNSATANLPMGGFKHTNCANASADNEYTTLGQIKAGVNIQGIPATGPTLSVENYNSLGGGPRIHLVKSRGGTVGTNTIVQNGDNLGSIYFYGAAGGTAYNTGALISGEVDGTPGATNDMPGRLVFSTTADGAGVPTERMRITNAGYVGMGTNNPLRLLQVGNLTSTPSANFTPTSGETNVVVAATQYATTNLIGSGICSVKFGDYADATVGEIYYNHFSDAMVFQVNASQGFRINSNGDILFNNVNAIVGLAGTFLTRAGSSTNPYLIVNTKTATGTVNVLQNHYNTTYVGGVSYDDTSTSFPTSSDYRLKENIVSISDASNRLKNLKPVRFNFISRPDQTIDGFLAHEVAEYVPNAVSGEKDAVNEDGSIKVQSLDHSKLVPLLTAAIKELIGRVEALEAQLA